MEILKIIGVILFLLGFALALYTLISAKRTGLFEEMSELKRIKETGYIKEHHEDLKEDVYKRDPVAERSRVMSRRAKRVLERMGEEEGLKEKPQGVARGTSLLEELPPSPTNSEEIKSAPSGVAFKVNPLHSLKKEKTLPAGTDVLPERGNQKSAPAPLKIDEEMTAPLVLESSEETAPLSSSEGTDILEVKHSATGGTDVLNKSKSADKGTDVLPKAKYEKSFESAGHEPSEEGTALLSNHSEKSVASEEDGTDILVRSGEGTDVLPSGENTDILPATEEGTDILTNDEEGTSLLERSEQ